LASFLNVDTIEKKALTNRKLHQNVYRVANGGLVAEYRSTRKNRPIFTSFARIEECFQAMKFLKMTKQ